VASAMAGSHISALRTRSVAAVRTQLLPSSPRRCCRTGRGACTCCCVWTSARQLQACSTAQSRRGGSQRTPQRLLGELHDDDARTARSSHLLPQNKVWYCVFDCVVWYSLGLRLCWLRVASNRNPLNRRSSPTLMIGSRYSCLTVKAQSFAQLAMAEHRQWLKRGFPAG